MPTCRLCIKIHGLILYEILACKMRNIITLTSCIHLCTNPHCIHTHAHWHRACINFMIDPCLIHLRPLSGDLDSALYYYAHMRMLCMHHSVETCHHHMFLCHAIMSLSCNMSSLLEGNTCPCNKYIPDYAIDF